MILIINSAGLNREAYRIERHSKELPLGSATIVSGLRNHGYKVIHRDLRNLVGPELEEPLKMEDYTAYIEKNINTVPMQQYLSSAFSHLPDLTEIKLIGMSVFSHINYIYALTLAAEIHKRYPDIPIVFGGAFINLKNLEIPSFVNFYIKGDGTGPIVHLANHYIRNSSLDESHGGLWYMKEDKLIANGINLDEPDMEEMPDYSDLELDRYLQSSDNSTEKYLKVPYRTSIGCPRNCSFCTTRLVDTKLKFKSVDKVVREVKALNSLHENVLIRFTDSSINNDINIAKQILDRFINDNFRFNWRAFAKMHDIDDELLEKAAKTGCKSLVWGVENASPHMISFFNKGYDINFAEQILKKASSLDIRNVIYLIFNGPGETEEDLDLNEQFVKRLCRDKNITFDFFEFLLEEGSHIYQEPKKYGIEIIGRDQKGDYTVRENIKWKELDIEYQEFLKKQQHHTERKISMMNYCRLETGLS